MLVPDDVMHWEAGAVMAGESVIGWSLGYPTSKAYTLPEYPDHHSEAGADTTANSDFEMEIPL